MLKNGKAASAASSPQRRAQACPKAHPIRYRLILTSNVCFKTPSDGIECLHKSHSFSFFFFASVDDVGDQQCLALM
jgi:hypothetical protein